MHELLIFGRKSNSLLTLDMRLRPHALEKCRPPKTRNRGDRFFDDVSAAEDATETDPAPLVSRTEEGGKGISDPSAKQRRPMLAGVPYLRLQLGLKLASGVPPFTNFTPEFTETLDYIFIEEGANTRHVGAGKKSFSDGCSSIKKNGHHGAVLTVDEGEAVARMPEEGALRAVTPGLPSKTFPSDHVSLAVDLVLSV